MSISKTIDEMKLGESYLIEKRFTDQDVRNYAKLCGDINPIHLDDQIAKESIFKKRVVHGMLTASLFSTIIGNFLPGNGSIYLGQNCDFIKPVFLEEKVKAKLTLIEKKEKNIVIFKTEVFNESGIKVVDGQAVVMPPKR